MFLNLVICFQLDVWAKERELAGLKASVSTLTNEVQRLQKMCEERRAAEDALRKKWKRIEEFDARRTELESIYTELIHLNLVYIILNGLLCLTILVINRIMG